MSSEDLTSEQAQIEPPPEEGKKIKQTLVQDTGPMMTLCLFLILLAFFILLVTTSKIDDTKRAAVFNSVAATFIANRLAQDDFDVHVNRIGEFLEDDLIELHKKLWLALVPLAEIKLQKSGSVMQVIMHSNELFEPGSSGMKRSTHDFVKRIVRSMNNPHEATKVRIIFYVDKVSNIDTRMALKQFHDGHNVLVEFRDNVRLNDLFDPQRYFSDLQSRSDKSFIVTTNADTIQFMRSMSIAHALEKEGASPEIMMVGVQQGVGQTVRVIYEHFNAQKEDLIILQ